jgi:hypothetical protein
LIAQNKKSILYPIFNNKKKNAHEAKWFGGNESSQLLPNSIDYRQRKIGGKTHGN